MLGAFPGEAPPSEKRGKGEEDAGFGTTAADGGESKLVKDIMNEAKVRDCG